MCAALHTLPCEAHDRCSPGARCLQPLRLHSLHRRSCCKEARRAARRLTGVCEPGRGPVGKHLFPPTPRPAGAPPPTPASPWARLSTVPGRPGRASAEVINRPFRDGTPDLHAEARGRYRTSASFVRRGKDKQAVWKYTGPVIKRGAAGEPRSSAHHSRLITAPPERRAEGPRLGQRGHGRPPLRRRRPRRVLYQYEHFNKLISKQGLGTASLSSHTPRFGVKCRFRGDGGAEGQPLPAASSAAPLHLIKSNHQLNRK
ncbi:hypothetical protein AAFF_G00396030 [Aldrovandia affinis]|uniref:Uncharacterized protein n=1 Tax=Aldrovandia affinis TaxID=143900 RepID=A0AAD7SDB0_9TELE|nr:hypothetical protein AAFF_G00396030 [Aldrovandia affinis]